MEANLDGSARFPWKISRGTHNAFTLSFSNDISSFSNWRFNVKLKGGPGTPVLTLSPGSGLTVVDGTTITGAFTSEQSALKKDKYYYELLADNASGKTVPFFRSEEFIVQDENTSDPTTSITPTITLGDTVVNVSVTVGGGTFDPDDITEEQAYELWTNYFQYFAVGQTPPLSE